jgi:hypothetical protein
MAIQLGPPIVAAAHRLLAVNYFDLLPQLRWLQRKAGPAEGNSPISGGAQTLKNSA